MEGRAYIIHIRPYRETSVLIDYLFEDFGMVRAIAKGVKNKKSPVNKNLQSFRLLWVNLVGRGDLKIVSSQDCLDYHIEISSDKLLYVMYANEVLYKLAVSNNLDHKFLFEKYRDLLSGFKNYLFLDFLLRKFELNLLKSLGYALQLEIEFTTGLPIEKNKYYFYDFAYGPCICKNEECTHKNCYLGDVLLTMDSSLRGNDAHFEKGGSAFGNDAHFEKGGSALGAGDFKKLLKSAINYYLDNKKLVTRETARWELMQ